MLNVALAKGRLADSCADIFIKCGIRAEILKEETRKLVLETPDKKFRFFFVKPSDVPTYVEYGIADIGVAGKDTLLEAGADLYEMLDLKFEKCRLCIAGFPEMKGVQKPRLRVATKYVNTAKQLFFSRGEDVEIIPLHGSIELAPLTGLSDVIFDIVQSGGTLKANGLVVLEEVFDISARLVANKVSLKTKAAEVLPLIAEMKKYANDINYDVARKFENEVRHDVMAHVKAFGEQAKSAKPIIHLGATSCYVTDNAEVIIIDNALDLVMKKLVNVMDKLKKFALKYKDLPTLGFTHLQPAQLTTVGKRATLWLSDLEMDYNNLVNLKNSVKLRGVKGTTGTQASFLDLFNGDSKKVKELEKRVVSKMGYAKVYGVTGQTYPRKFDYNVLCVLSQIAQSAYRFSNDIRLLQHMKEVEEPFEKHQIGSSAMAYKRNPMRSERVSSLARYVLSLPVNAAVTASTQWFERTLDDSANKRIVIAQAFLSVDAILNLYLNISENLVVYDKVIAKHIAAELPFMATENIMMECVKAGGDRQELHERIRVLSMEAGKNVKQEGKDNNLIELIRNDDMFRDVWDKLDDILDARNFIGRSKDQVEEFIAEEIDPILDAHKNELGEHGEVRV